MLFFKTMLHQEVLDKEQKIYMGQTNIRTFQTMHTFMEDILTPHDCNVFLLLLRNKIIKFDFISIFSSTYHGKKTPGL